MDCDCELLHNEPPSIPVYLSFLFFSFSSHHLLSYALLSHVHALTHMDIHIMYAYARRCSYMHSKSM